MVAIDDPPLGIDLLIGLVWRWAHASREAEHLIGGTDLASPPP